MATENKNVRTKRSRLGRGLSALVEVPVVEVAGPENEGTRQSDNLSQDGEHVDGGVAVHNTNIKSSVAGSAHSDLGEKRVRGGAVARDGKNTKQAGTGTETESAGETGVGAGRVVGVAVDLIAANKDQPRRVFDEGALASLAESIGEHGLMQPVVLRMVNGGGQGGGVEQRYELIAGERRWRASRMAGLEVIPAIVREVDDVTSAQLALIENVQREDLNVVELAEGYRVLSDRYSMTQEQIAKSVGVSRSSVANITRLLELPTEVRDLISQGSLTSGHGKVLLSLGMPEKQRKFAARCLKEGWNVRQLERACNDESDGLAQDDVADSKLGKNTENDRAVSVLRDLEQRVGDELGTRVRIRTDKSRKRGRLVIEFYDLDQFDGLLGRLGVKAEG